MSPKVTNKEVSAWLDKIGKAPKPLPSVRVTATCLETKQVVAEFGELISPAALKRKCGPGRYKLVVYLPKNGKLVYAGSRRVTV